MFMKKICAVCVIFILAIPFIACADMPTIADFSNEELVQIINSAYAELARRTAVDGDIIIQRDGITILKSGDAYVERVYLRIPVVIINDTDEATTLVSDGCVINGWTATALAPDFAEPHSRVKTELVFKIDEAECTTLEDVKSVDVKYYLEMKVDGKYSYNKEISEIYIVP